MAELALVDAAVALLGLVPVELLVDVAQVDVVLVDVVLVDVVLVDAAQVDVVLVDVVMVAPALNSLCCKILRTKTIQSGGSQTQPYQAVHKTFPLIRDLCN